MTKKQVVETLMKLESVRELVEEIKEDEADGYYEWAKMGKLKLRGMIQLAKELKIIETTERRSYEIIKWLKGE